jgi:hypothetical protein
MLEEGVGTDKEWLETGRKEQANIREIVHGRLSSEVSGGPGLIFQRRSWVGRKTESQAHGLEIPSFRIRARRVLRLSPRISAAPFFPLTFH